MQTNTQTHHPALFNSVNEETSDLTIREPSAITLCSSKGFVLAISPYIGLSFYAIGLFISSHIAKLHYEIDSPNHINMDGQLFSAALGVSAFLCVIFAMAQHQRYFHPHHRDASERKIKAAGLLGLVSGLFTALFTAKHIDGLTKPVTHQGISGDYAFTDNSGLYILVLSLATAAFFCNMMKGIQQCSVTRSVQFGSNHSDRQPLNPSSPPDQEMQRYG